MSRIVNPGPAQLAEEARSVRSVHIRDLMLDAHIGVYRHEHGQTQPVRLNIELTLAGPFPDPAYIDAGGALADRIRAAVARGHVKLVETLAEMVAQACLEDPRVLSARVRIEKPAVLPGTARVGVEIERARPG